MALQLSTRVRNAQAEAIETTVGTSPTLEIRTGAPPANPAASDSGTLLATLTLPSNWLGAASSGAVELAGSWTGEVSTSGTAGHFRIKASGGACDAQGTVSQRESDGGTGDLKLAQATAALVAGQSLTISAFTITVGGA